MENGHRVQGNITCGQLPPGEDEEGGATDHGEEHIDNVRIKGGQLFDVDIDRFLLEMILFPSVSGFSSSS